MDIKIENVEYTELPEIEKAYVAAIRKAVELKMKKIHDYNNGDVSREDYYINGEYDLLYEINKKVLRLRSLYSSEETPKCEAVEDTLLDIINYAADLWSYITLEDMKA